MNKYRYRILLLTGLFLHATCWIFFYNVVGKDLISGDFPNVHLTMRGESIAHKLGAKSTDYEWLKDEL